MRCLPILMLLFFSCRSDLNIFDSKSLHEKYGNRLKDAGLHHTSLGKLWFAAAHQALTSPRHVHVPYKEIGYFAAEKPAATGLKFTANRGEKLHFSISKNPAVDFILFAELFRVNVKGDTALIESLDTTSHAFEHEVRSSEDTFLLRLQPELLKSGEYTLSISIGPSLGYPVAGQYRIGSFWGADRAGGARKHEGIDIFAPRGTPAVAAADGVVTSVRDNKLGGKVVFMRPAGKDYSLYYAHLDAQSVTDGQRVKAGEEIGKIGNTGNARSTPPHLHFGIYTRRGAVDPLPFVNPEVKAPEDVRRDIKFQNTYRLRNSTRIKNRTYTVHTPVKVNAVSSSSMAVTLPDGTTATVAGNLVVDADVIKMVTVAGNQAIRNSPSTEAPRKYFVGKEDQLQVIGAYSDFSFVRNENGTPGWIATHLLR